MGKNSETRASFYKFLNNDDFNSRLRIPPDFMRNYGEILPRKTTLRTDEPGKSWRVRIEQLGQRHFFTQGWAEFAKDVDLKFREFVLFKLVDGSAFHVSVYEVNGCKKESYPGTRDRNEGPGNSQLKVKIENEEHFPDQENGSCAVRSWKFSKELRVSHFKDRLSIPKHFAVGTGIATNRKITLVDEQGREWPVKVTDRNLGVFAMTAGWRNFLIGNQVPVGSTISFEFITGSDNMIQVRVLKNEAREVQILSCN